MPSADKRSRIPVGTQFSPDLIDLPEFLKMAITHSGDITALRTAVIQPPVRIQSYQKPPTHRQINLPLEAAVQYELLEPRTYLATPLALQLATLLSPQEIFDAFARHILLNLGGLRIVEAAQEMALDQQEITGDTLAQYLTDQGFRVTVHNTAINTMRMWLAKAGLFPVGRSRDAWIPNLMVKERLIGLSDQSISALANLSSKQIAFVNTLCRLEPSEWINAADVRDLAETTFGLRFGRSSLPNEVLSPLQRAGLLEFETGGTKSGKTSRLRLTDKFRVEMLQPFLEKTLSDLDPTLTTYYRTRPEDIYVALESPEKHIRGFASEAYTIHVMRLLGLRFVGWRKRAKDTPTVK